MYRVKVQLNNGEVREVDVAKLIIEGCGGNGRDEIHLTATDEGVIVDMVSDDDVVATACMDPECLSEKCS